MTYAPYAHHQQKTLLRQSAREISQSLADARNFAIHGLDTWSWNVNMVLYFASGATEVVYYAYPLSEAINLTNLDIDKVYKIKKLPLWTQVDSFNGVSWEYTFTFDAITGDGNIIGIDEFPIQISYKWSINTVLQSIITYYPQTYISDY